MAMEGQDARGPAKGIECECSASHTWNPVNLTPVSNDVVSFAVLIIRSTFSGEADSSYRIVPSLMSRMFGFLKGKDRFSRTRFCGVASIHVHCLATCNSPASPPQPVAGPSSPDPPPPQPSPRATACPRTSGDSVSRGRWDYRPRAPDRTRAPRGERA